MLSMVLISTVFAQEIATSYTPQFDPEKIYLFDVNIEVLQNGRIVVTENITLNARHQQINRGIYRDIPISLLEQVEPISLTLDGKKHPFFTEKKPKYLRVNFGDDNYIDTGVHTYSFVYAYTGAINFLKNYDELYWNVTGNGWNFDIDKAQVSVSFPSNVEINKNGISAYTGVLGAKGRSVQEVAPLTYETTRTLRPTEGLTIAIPFQKGAIQPPSLSQRLSGIASCPLFFSIVVSFILLFYFIITWAKVGKDPSYLALTQYTPPEGISPAFMYYLENGMVDAKLLTCAILDLAMKGHIEVNKTKSFFSQHELVLKNMPTEKLPIEENEMIRRFFTRSSSFTLNKQHTEVFGKLTQEIKILFSQQCKPYIVSNAGYLLIAGILVLFLGTVPFILGKNAPLIFINFHFSIFFIFLSLGINKMIPKIFLSLFLTAFYGVFWIGAGQINGPDILICQILFIFSMWGLSLYATLIRNVTPQGKVLFEAISGFKKYMKIAEVNRVAASNPVEAEKIFCDYLPFAFALGLYNKWMKQFSHILSKDTIERCTASAGGAHFIARGLSSSISSSMSSNSGSHGGGCSGGGHGGGGGGGR